MSSFKSKLAPIIKEFLEYRKSLGYSGYRHEKPLAMLDDYYSMYHCELKTLTKESVRGWVRYEISRGDMGMYNKISAVRMLAQYMGNGAYVLPTTAIPKRPVSMPYILTDDELSRLFAAADNMKGNTDNSVKLMFPTLLRLLYTCGLRPNEIRLIERDNINFDNGEILISKTKAHKERIVVMSDDMLDQCRKYDIISGFMNPSRKYFFARTDNTPIPSYQLWYNLNLCWRQANPDVPENMLPKIRPYNLRHRFTSAILQKWIDEGRDLYAMLPYLRAYLGHEDLSSTAYYIHLLPENLLNSKGVDWSGIDSVNPEVGVWEN
jgi:integrase